MKPELVLRWIYSNGRSRHAHPSSAPRGGSGRPAKPKDRKGTIPVNCTKCEGTGKGERGFYNCRPCSGSGKVPPLQGNWRDVLKALDALGASYSIVATQEIWFEYAGHEAKLTTPVKDPHAMWTLTAWDADEREVTFDRLSAFAMFCNAELGDMLAH